jgi:hypothetical protein
MHSVVKLGCRRRHWISLQTRMLTHHGCSRRYGMPPRSSVTVWHCMWIISIQQKAGQTGEHAFDLIQDHLAEVALQSPLPSPYKPSADELKPCRLSGVVSIKGPFGIIGDSGPGCECMFCAPCSVLMGFSADTPAPSGRRCIPRCCWNILRGWGQCGGWPLQPEAPFICRIYWGVDA